MPAHPAMPAHRVEATLPGSSLSEVPGLSNMGCADAVESAGRWRASPRNQRSNSAPSRPIARRARPLSPPCLGLGSGSGSGRMARFIDPIGAVCALEGVGDRRAPLWLAQACHADVDEPERDEEGAGDVGELLAAAELRAGHLFRLVLVGHRQLVAPREDGGDGGEGAAREDDDREAKALLRDVEAALVLVVIEERRRDLALTARSILGL